MAVYFYHFRTAGGALLEDDIGSNLATDEEAVLEAVLVAAELVRGWPTAAAGGAFEVHDEGGWLVERVPVWRH